ncbi:hypothetical protein HOT57_gp38 [Pseudomonas phage phCDa]|uniref:Uncharacterized protein n=1 Tax=Pseudomonas phage phCDa TaxID=2268587 RepID=A0A2Z5HAE4_9CAUD|nr:hypothetical protein HOT57_gp38 [Pseudomonas phage phCDa]AXC36482.1 hypothetical protein phCDa_38 [Pseudomonas phage phCDa]
MQTFINVMTVLILLAFLALMLRELARSQKSAELPKDHFKYVMHIQYVAVKGEEPVIRRHSANSLQYMQETLNNVVFHAIDNAVVFCAGRVTHRMDKTSGVLCEVPSDANRI